jgi:hypothetical protein
MTADCFARAYIELVERPSGTLLLRSRAALGHWTRAAVVERLHAETGGPDTIMP